MFRKPTRPSLPLRKAPPLTPSPLSSGAREKTALLGARNRYAIRLSDHQRSRHIMRDGTAWDNHRDKELLALHFTIISFMI